MLDDDCHDSPRSNALRNDLMSFVQRVFDHVFSRIVLRKGEIKIVKFCLSSCKLSEINTENVGPTTRVIILNRLLYPLRHSKALRALSTYMVPTLSVS